MKQLLNFKMFFLVATVIAATACASQKTGDVTLTDEPVAKKPMAYSGADRTEGVRMTARERNPASTATDTAVDNSQINRRDRYNKTITPQDQALGSDHDVEITRRVRQELVKDKTLSTYAKNIKITTLDGITTLRGPVQTENERQRVLSIANGIVSRDQISNFIEVKQK